MISPASLGCIPYNCPPGVMACAVRKPETNWICSFFRNARLGHKSSAWIGRKRFLDVFGTSQVRNDMWNKG